MINELVKTRIPVKSIVFDAYGTLFDVNSVAIKCEQLFPGKGSAISTLWRSKQLQYTWLRSLMGRYVDFWLVTDESLRFTLTELGLVASDTIRQEILSEYLALATYPEVPKALQELSAEYKLAILSNGSPRMLNEVVKNAGLTSLFTSVISVDEVEIYKPSPSVYGLTSSHVGFESHQILFVSSNAWDAAGAKTFGMQVCWINRFRQNFEELAVKPDATIFSLDELPAVIMNPK